MPLPDADRHALEQIEHHREQMADWKRARAQRIIADYEAGKSVEEIAAELGLAAPTIYELMRAGRTKPLKRGRPPKKRANDTGEDRPPTE